MLSPPKKIKISQAPPGPLSLPQPLPRPPRRQDSDLRPAEVVGLQGGAEAAAAVHHRGPPEDQHGQASTWEGMSRA